MKLIFRHALAAVALLSLLLVPLARNEAKAAAPIGLLPTPAPDRFLLVIEDGKAEPAIYAIAGNGQGQYRFVFNEDSHYQLQSILIDVKAGEAVMVVTDGSKGSPHQYVVLSSRSLGQPLLGTGCGLAC